MRTPVRRNMDHSKIQFTGQKLLKLLCSISFVLALFAPQSIWPKVLKNQSLFSVAQQKCLTRVLHNPVREYFYPQLFNDTQFSEPEKELMDESINYCQCYAREKAHLDLLKSENPIAYSFRDKSREFEIDDSCAVEHFSKKSLEYFYLLNVGTVLKSMANVRVNSSLVQGLVIFKNKREIASQVECVEEKIIKKCTKVKSLKMSYDCIVKQTTNPIFLDDHHKSCRHDQINLNLDEIEFI